MTAPCVGQSLASVSNALPGLTGALMRLVSRVSSSIHVTCHRPALTPKYSAPAVVVIVQHVETQNQAKSAVIQSLSSCSNQPRHVNVCVTVVGKKKGVMAINTVMPPPTTLCGGKLFSVQQLDHELF